MGKIASTINALWPPKPTYSVDDIPDLTGKVVIVTGGTAGHGRETVKALLNHNAKVYLAARNADKASRTIQELLGETNKEAIFLKLDLASLNSVKKAAEEFQGKEKELHILFNNAGVLADSSEPLTVDGYDLQFGTNVLGPYYFTKLLLPTLLSTAKTVSGNKVRVVTTSSMLHLLTGLDFNTFRDSPRRRKKHAPTTLYGQSKLGGIVFATELARRYGDEGVISMSVHPGVTKSELFRKFNFIYRSMVHIIFPYPPPMGALTQLWGGTSPEGLNFNGKYLTAWARIGTASRDAQNPEIGTQLWNWLEEQAEIFEASSRSS